MLNTAIQPYISVNLPLTLPQKLQLPTILDYLNINTTLHVIIRKVFSDNRYLLDLNGLLLEAVIPITLTSGSRVPLRVREFSEDNVVLDIMLTNGLSELRSEQERKPIEQYIRIGEKDISTILRTIEEPVTPTNIKIVTELLRKNAPINKETFQAVLTILSHNNTEQPAQTEQAVINTNQSDKLHLSTTSQTHISQDTISKIATTAFLLSRGIEPSRELVNTFNKLNISSKVNIAPNVSQTNNRADSTMNIRPPINIIPHPSQKTSIDNINIPERLSQTSPIVKSALDFIKLISLDMDKIINNDAPHQKIQTALSEMQITKSIPDAVINVIANVLEKSPQLAYLDKAVTLVEKLINQLPQQLPEQVESQITVNAILNLIAKEIEIIKSDRETVEMGINSNITEQKINNIRENITNLKQHELTILRARLLEREMKEIEANPLLSQARLEKGNTLDVVDKLAAFRILNQLSMLRMDGIYITEIPTYIDGKLLTIPVRIFHKRIDSQGKEHRNKGKREPQDFTITIDISMTKIGNVRTLMSILHSKDPSRKNVSISFNVKNKNVKSHFDKHTDELTRTLNSMGYSSAISTTIAESPSTNYDPEIDNPNILDLYSNTEKRYVSVDIRI